MQASRRYAAGHTAGRRGSAGVWVTLMTGHGGIRIADVPTGRSRWDVRAGEPAARARSRLAVNRFVAPHEPRGERWRLARLDDHVVATRGVVEVDHARNDKHRALAPLVPQGAVRRVRADDADHRHG